MSGDRYQTVTASIPYKTIGQLNRAAEEYGISRANLIMHFVEQGLSDMGFPLEVSPTNLNGIRRDTGTPVSVQNMKRKIL